MLACDIERTTSLKEYFNISLLYKPQIMRSDVVCPGFSVYLFIWYT